jgi:hypothetical protein
MITLADFAQPLNDVQYFDEFKGELSYSQKRKAEKFLGLNLVVYLGSGKFACNPIEGYNHTVHVMTKEDGEWRCRCQGFNKMDKAFKAGLSPNKPFCSHLLALMLAFKEKRFKNDV